MEKIKDLNFVVESSYHEKSFDGISYFDDFLSGFLFFWIFMRWVSQIFSFLCLICVGHLLGCCETKLLHFKALLWQLS